MNIDECRQVLSYLFSTHPNAPTLTKDDKTRMVAAYFRVLYRYTLPDVLTAVDAFGKQNPAFIPTAYEIENNIVRTLNIDRFLPPEYWELDKELYQYKAINIYSFQADLRVKYRLSDNEKEKEILKKEFENCEKRKEIDWRRIELYNEAEKKAHEYYERECVKHSGITLENMEELQ